VWSVLPGERALRSTYIGLPWLTPTLTAKCFDATLHQPLDPNCSAGVYAFAHLDDALQEGLLLKIFTPRWKPAINPTEIVVVLGLVELTGRITEVREERFDASGAHWSLKAKRQQFRASF
jgi:hypothetical protein